MPIPGLRGPDHCHSCTPDLLSGTPQCAVCEATFEEYLETSIDTECGSIIVNGTGYSAHVTPHCIVASGRLGAIQGDGCHLKTPNGLGLNYLRVSPGSSV